MRAAMSQSFSRGYGSVLPTSLTYIVHALEALHLGDLLRISVRPTRALLPPLFTGRRARANRACALPFGRAHRTASQPDSAVCAALGANRKLASPLPPASQGSHCCQRGTRRRRDLSRLPFAATPERCVQRSCASA